MSEDTETWYQQAWRPACGFALAASTVFGTVGSVFLAALGIIYKDPTALSTITGLITGLAALFVPAGSISGIASYYRGQEKLAAASNTVTTDPATKG